MQELKPIKEGKVREIYDNGDSLIMVATDRISCFDVILHNEVTKKGTVLTQMSDHIKTADTVCGNHNQAFAVVINLTNFSFFDRF